MKGNYLGEVAALVLTVIGISETTNAVEIKEIIHIILGKRLHTGVLYNTLKRLENDGFIESDKAVMNRVDERLRKTYVLSKKGQRQFENEQMLRARLKQVALSEFNKTIH